MKPPVVCCFCCGREFSTIGNLQMHFLVKAYQPHLAVKYDRQIRARREYRRRRKKSQGN